MGSAPPLTCTGCHADVHAGQLARPGKGTDCADLGPRVALRLSVMGRGAFDSAGEGAARSPYGVTGHAAVAASY